MRAPCTAPIPIAPNPNTATSVPASTGNRHTANPRPTADGQPRIDSSAGETRVKIGTTQSSSDTSNSALPPGPIGRDVIYTGVLSDIVAETIDGSRVRQLSPRPTRQLPQTPHCGVAEMMTWSPTLTRLTA